MAKKKNSKQTRATAKQAEVPVQPDDSQEPPGGKVIVLISSDF